MARRLFVTSRLELGTVSGELEAADPAEIRVDADQFDPACVCEGASFNGEECSTNDNRQSSWNQWWLDLHSPECKVSVQNVMETRILRAKEKGCDGIDPDNVDSVSC